MKYKKKYLLAKKNISGGKINPEDILNFYAKKDNIIGSGGFGLVLKHDSDNTVIKLMYQSTCKQAEFEYSIHADIYKHVSIYIDGKNLQILLPEPIDFQNFKTSLSIPDLSKEKFDCSYRMTLLNNLSSLLPERKYIIQLALGHDDANFDQNIGKDGTSNIHERNPPRGTFIGPNVIKKLLENEKIKSISGNIKTVKDISYRIGVLVGISFFLADFIPSDAEFVLCLNNGQINLGFLDFGMFEKINYLDKDLLHHIKSSLTKLQYDQYIPYDDQYREDFIRGVKEIYDSSKTDKSTKIIEDNKKNIFDYLVTEIFVD